MALLSPGEPMSRNPEVVRLREENAELKHRLERIQNKVHHMRRWGLECEQMDPVPDGDYLDRDQVINTVSHWADLSKKVKVP